MAEEKDERLKAALAYFVLFLLALFFSWILAGWL